MCFLLKSTLISILLLIFSDRLFLIHQTTSWFPTSLLAEQFLLLMRPIAVVPSVNLMIWFELYLAQ